MALSGGKRKWNCNKAFITLTELLKYFCRYMWMIGIFPFAFKEENLLREGEAAFTFSKKKLIPLFVFTLELVFLLLIEGIPKVQVDDSLTFVASLFSAVIVYLLLTYGAFLFTLIKAKKIATILDKLIKLEQKKRIKSSVFTSQSLFIVLACTLQGCLYIATILLFFVDNLVFQRQILYGIAATHVILADIIFYLLSMVSLLFLSQAFEKVKEDAEISVKQKNLRMLKECRESHAYLRRISKEIGSVFMVPMCFNFGIMLFFICTMSLIIYSQIQTNQEFVSTGFLCFEFAFQFPFLYMTYFPYNEATRKANIKETLITLNMKNKKTQNSKDMLIELNRFCSEVTANQVQFRLGGVFEMNMAGCRENLEYIITVIVWVIQIGMNDI